MIPIVAGAVVAIVAVIAVVDGLLVWKSMSGKSRELGGESRNCRWGLDPLGNAHVLT